MDFKNIETEIEVALEHAGVPIFCKVAQIVGATGRSERAIYGAIARGELVACQRMKGAAITLLRRHVAKYLASITSQHGGKA